MNTLETSVIAAFALIILLGYKQWRIYNYQQTQIEELKSALNEKSIQQSRGILVDMNAHGDLAHRIFEVEKYLGIEKEKGEPPIGFDKTDYDAALKAKKREHAIRYEQLIWGFPPIPPRGKFATNENADFQWQKLMEVRNLLDLLITKLGYKIVGSETTSIRIEKIPEKTRVKK